MSAGPDRATRADQAHGVGAAGRGRPRLHLPSMLGRARADVRALLLTALVVALTTLLTAVVPPLGERTADRSVADAVVRAGDAGAVVLSAPYDDTDASEPRVRDPGSAQQVADVAAQARFTLPAGLRQVLQPGVATVTSGELHVLGGGPGRYLTIAYVADARGTPAVRWTAGHPPRSSAPGGASRVTVAPDGPPWPVQVGLSSAAAAALGVHVGERLHTQDARFQQEVVVVSGLYAPLDPADPRWRADPRLLHPDRGREEQSTRTAVTALVTDVSLPDLQLAAVGPGLRRTVAFTPRPSALRWHVAGALARQVVALKTTASAGDDGYGAPMSWDSQLDRVLRDADAAVQAARSQASVLLAGLLLAAGLVLALAGQLLAARRAGTLASARERGAGLPGVALELVVESVLVTVLGGAAGLLGAALLAGRPSWSWPLPVLAVAVLAGPLLGVRTAARATGARRAPANRSARRAAARAVLARRLGAEGLVVLVAVAAGVALRQRGVLTGELLPLAAPTLLTAAAAVLLLRVLPAAARLAVDRARRSPRGTPLFAAAGAAANARALPFLTLLVVAAELALGAALAGTTGAGQAAGAWREVGADVRLETDPAASVSTLAARAAAAPGVRAAVAGRVADGVPASGSRTSAVVRLVVVDAAAYRRLLGQGPLPAPAGLDRLRRAGSAGGPVPALLRGGDPDLRDGLTVTWQDHRVPLAVIGSGPAVGTGSVPVVVVDAQAFAAAGAVADPGTVWVVGPGAGRAAATAARALAGTDAGAPTLVRRSAVLTDRRTAPLAAGLTRLAVTATGLLLVLGGLAVALAAALGGPARATALARLRTIGLDRRQARAVLVGELVPPVALAVLLGLVAGAGCALATFGHLSLELVTGQADPPTAKVPWWVLLPAAALVAAALVGALLETVRRRRAVLGEVLRVGG